MSTNLSQQRRADLAAKIKAIHEYIASCRQDENTRNLLAYLAELETEISAKKFGLVFEEHREEIDETLETHTPVLTEDKKLFIDNGGQVNFLIEGDNLAALKLLLKTHKEKIDVIYIDPPYNTLSQGFTYSDKLVDKNDTFRHSKWLSFMDKRLQIACTLLSDNGVIFVSIDDNEQANLKILMDNVFGESNFVAQMIRVSSPTQNIASFVSIMHDYALVYCKNKQANNGNWQVKKNNAEEYQKRARDLIKRKLTRKEIETELRELIKYPRFFDFDHYYYCDEKGVYQTVSMGGVDKGNTKTDVIHPKTNKICQKPQGGWRYKEEELIRLVENHEIEFGVDETIIPRKKLYI